MEVLLRANRFFGVSLSLLQTSQASFLSASILAGSFVTTFDLFTEEWSRHPLRVQLAQEARRLAGIAGGRASAAASAARAAALGVFSSNTGRPDGMGMNIAGGAAEVQAQALEYDVTPAEVAQAARGTAGCFGGTATAGKNAPAATAAAALLSRGAHNAKKRAHFVKNPDAVRLGAEIVYLSIFMGRMAWQRYTTTSPAAMLEPEKPLAEKVSKRMATARCWRAGWEFHHATNSGSTWTLEDNITFTMPGHSDENPVWHVESMREAISETYHILWSRHLDAERSRKKDKDAGMKLNRTNAKGSSGRFPLEAHTGV